MKHVIQDFKTGDIRVADVPRPQVEAGSVLVKNHYSCISAGTEKLMIELEERATSARPKNGWISPSRSSTSPKRRLRLDVQDGNGAT
jgi:hypothetical protein